MRIKTILYKRTVWAVIPTIVVYSDLFKRHKSYTLALAILCFFIGIRLVIRE